MRLGIVCLAGLLYASVAIAGLTPLFDIGIMSDPEVQRVLNRDPIHIHTSGTDTAEFEAIATGLGRSNLVMDVQTTYARMLPAGQKPEFVIRQDTTNTYFYVNKYGERSDIREVLRRADTPESILCVYLVRGKRFFGMFEAAIQIEARRGAGGATSYTVDVYARPEVTVTRFLAKHLPLVDRYFQRKTRDVVTLVVGIVRESVTGSHPTASTGSR
ncbi:MAG: hypothetical protein WCL49_10385 [bacterium]